VAFGVRKLGAPTSLKAPGRLSKIELAITTMNFLGSENGEISVPVHVRAASHPSYVRSSPVQTTEVGHSSMASLQPVLPIM